MKMMKPSFVLSVLALAPMAMPSAAAWITSPVVVARLRVCLGVGARDCRKDSDSGSEIGEEGEERPIERLSREMCRVGGGGCMFSEAWRGSLSTRYMRMKPSIRERPM